MQNQSISDSSMNYYEESVDKKNKIILDQIDSQIPQNAHYKNVFIEKKNIGRGGFGQVFHVQNKFDDEDYAMKKILLTENRNLSRILGEIKIWSKLESNFIVKYKSSWIECGDWSEDNDENSQTLPNQRILYIQMELCQMTLKEALNKINEELDQNFEKGVTLIDAYLASELFIEILEGVNYLHSQSPPIIHRDLKLVNILITNGKNGNFVKISDFGLSTIHSIDNGDKTDVENFDINYFHTSELGSYEYMAEEVRSGKYDTSADMYSLGVIFRKMFCINVNDLNTLDESHQIEFRYYPIKQLKHIKNLLDDWPSKRNNCNKLLSEKHEWAVNFDEIKFADDLKEILYNHSISGFNNKSIPKPISTLLLVKKCYVEIDKNVNLKTAAKNVSNRNIDDLQIMRSAINSNYFETMSNMDNNLKSSILKLILHLMNVCESLDELCFFVEKKLFEITNTQWHCFCQKIYPFMEALINWFNNPLYIIYFANRFREVIVEIAIINTYDFRPKEFPEFASIINTMNDEMSEKSKNLSYKALNECESIEKMQLYISDSLKQLYNNFEWNCYISKNELISFYTLFPTPKYKYAIRIKNICILIVSESIINVICGKVDE